MTPERTGPGVYFLRAFQFHVTLVQKDSGEPICDGGFQEVSGLEISMEPLMVIEGGNNAQEIQLPGRARYAPIQLKRGMLYAPQGQVNSNPWRWIQGIVRGQIVRCRGMIEVVGIEHGVKARWVFIDGLPIRVRGPELNAKAGEIAIEELHIAHQGLILKG